METKQYKKHIVIKPSIHLCHTPLSLKALTHATDKVMVFLECLSPLFTKAGIYHKINKDRLDFNCMENRSVIN
ncbi:hypothetical protein A1OU_16535 [Enterovibrio norvegicus]|nr:hypothetical protein A1OU_16535 [Enterovibrio norvegicus]